MAMIMQQGEVREVGIQVLNNSNTSFTIDSAEYNVYSATDKTRLDSLASGGCTITEDNKILCLYSATSIGQFIVEITYRIPPEILKAQIVVSVR